MSPKRAAPKSKPEAGPSAAWNGVERRRTRDRRDTDRRIDERRRAGIGEVMSDRRERAGRRKSDRRGGRKRRAADSQ